MRFEPHVPQSKVPFFRSILSKWKRNGQDFRHNQRGMTLVEVMVSLTLTAVIVGIVSLMMSQSDRQFRFISQQSMIEREYRELTDFLSALFRRQAVSDLQIPQNAGGTVPDETILLKWTGSDPGMTGMLLRSGKMLIWRQLKQSEEGNAPIESNLALADELKDIQFSLDKESGKIQAEMSWEMSNGQTITRTWQVHVTRLDQPVLPAPSMDPLPEPTEP